MEKIVATLIIGMLAVSLNAQNLLGTGDVSKENGWDVWVGKAALDAGEKADFQGGKLVVKCTLFEKQGQFDIQLKRAIELDADKNYKLKFKASTDKEGKIVINYALLRPPYAGYAKPVAATLLVGEREYECVIATKKDAAGNYETPRGFNIAVGGFENANVTISNASLEEVK